MNIGKVVGGVLFVGGIAAIWLWPKGPAVKDEPEPVRPVRSMIVKHGVTMPDLIFSGVVKATETRGLAFKQSGRIAKIPVSKGQEMKKGEKVAWLDPSDFQNNLTKAESSLELARITYERNKAAFDKHAVSQQELTKAEAQLKDSEAAYALAKRALEETVLYAPFDGEVTDVPGTELDIANTGYVVVVFQDTSCLKIEVSVPENIVISTKQFQAVGDEVKYMVRFDSMPEKSYPVTFHEYRMDADVKTQTYIATFKMPAQPELTLLPGMSASVTLLGSSYAHSSDEKNFTDNPTVPESAVGVASDGSRFVWLLTDEKDGVYTAKRQPVELLNRLDSGLIVKGISDGARIATAGVSLLVEGQKVVLL